VSKQVKGFLASDNTFFDREPECKRYETMKQLEGMCESHGINFENFMVCLNGWNKMIREYYNADERCKEKYVGSETKFTEYDGSNDVPIDETLLPTEGDTTNPPIGDKNAPGFLEQQIRKYK
jgi:hypothetical protein